MPKWICCSDGVIQADVVRWREAVWKRGRRKGSRAVKIGQRSVVAQVTHVEPGWLRLRVIESRILEEKQGHRLTEVLKKDQEVSRKRQSLARGNPERLAWSDESVRAALASRFLGNSHG